MMAVAVHPSSPPDSMSSAGPCRLLPAGLLSLRCPMPPAAAAALPMRPLPIPAVGRVGAPRWPGSLRPHEEIDCYLRPPYPQRHLKKLKGVRMVVSQTNFSPHGFVSFVH
ncbi:unnamed protein product [Urochloa humidicola]